MHKSRKVPLYASIGGESSILWFILVRFYGGNAKPKLLIPLREGPILR